MGRVTKLFEPIRIGAMELRNRVVMTGIAINSAEDTTMSGVLHQKYIDFFEERAKGGTGLIILPDTCIDRNLRFQSHPCIGGDEFNPGLSALTEAVHIWGAKIAPDLYHGGYLHTTFMSPQFPYGEDWRPLSSSSNFSFMGRVSREMNTEEIEAVERQFAEAALRAKMTGFDAVHLAGHYGFLIAQFLSPAFNKRTDHYGGSLENRMRFAVEIVEKIREKIGPALPIIFRLSADELIEGGLTLKETAVIAKRLEEAGVDCLNITGGLGLLEVYHRSIPPMGSPQGPFVELAAKIKQAVTIPVIIAGRIIDPLFAEKIIEDGKADMVGMARQLFADPEWPVKAWEGRLSDIAPCIGCNVCIQTLLERTISRCSVNPAVGREREFRIIPALKPLKVVVVGGGPAGMEAARVAALRGHRVSLYERENTLGGQLLLSVKPPFKDEMRKFTEYLVHQVEKAGVEINLSVEVTPEIVKEESPDVVIAATGVRPLIPQIPGISGRNVVTAWDVLAGREVGERVVIAGGGMVGCETAEYLIQKGKRVSIVEMLPEVASDVEKLTVRRAMMERFSHYELDIMVNSKVEEVTGEGLVITQHGERKVVVADTVVLALGAVPNDTLPRQLRNTIQRLYTIGDGLKPGRIVDAMNQASYLAHHL